MSESLYSVGLDVGTTSTQMILSKLTVENKASAFAVPEMAITGRRILYESAVHFTPLKSENLVDGQALRQLVLQEYDRAGIVPSQVDTGAVIITGETSRKENAAEVLESLSALAGEFVVATAGPHLESVLAAKGAGAVDYSAESGKTVLHMDIGGGTSNLALIQSGKIVQTGCLNVGGRLIKLREDGVITYVSPVLQPLTDLQVGQKPTQMALEEVCRLLCQVLEMAAGRLPVTPLLKELGTRETESDWVIPAEPVTVSFSGGVADCIEKDHPPFAFGDIGVLLGRQIGGSSLCSGGYVTAKQTIRATVIGAGCHSTQLSGSTVFCRNAKLPKKNMQVIPISRQEDAAAIAAKLSAAETEAVLALEGYSAPNYQQVAALAEKLAQAAGGRALYVCLQQDMAKALGQCLSLLLPPHTPCICLDKLSFGQESYLDIGLPVGPCYPVVIKTLVLSNR